MDAALEKDGIPYPTFDEDTLDQLPYEFRDDCRSLVNSCEELKKLAFGATSSIMDVGLNVRALFL